MCSTVFFGKVFRKRTAPAPASEDSVSRACCDQKGRSASHDMRSAEPHTGTLSYIGRCPQASDVGLDRNYNHAPCQAWCTVRATLQSGRYSIQSVLKKRSPSSLRSRRPHVRHPMTELERPIICYWGACASDKTKATRSTLCPQLLCCTKEQAFPKILNAPNRFSAVLSVLVPGGSLQFYKLATEMIGLSSPLSHGLEIRGAASWASGVHGKVLRLSFLFSFSPGSVRLGAWH